MKTYLSTGLRLSLIIIMLAAVFVQPASAQPLTTDASILFQDDFNDGNADGWTTSGSGTWYVENGEYVVSMGNGVELLGTSVAGDESWTDFSLELDIKGELGVDKMICIRNQGTTCYYWINIRSAPFNDILLTYGTTIINSVPYGNSAGIWYHVKADWHGANILVYVSGTQLMDYTISGSYVPSGNIRLSGWTGAWGSDVVRYDNVKVSGTPALTDHIISDATVKYSEILYEGWETPGFDDSAWQNVVAPSIGLCDLNMGGGGRIPGSTALPVWRPNPQQYQTIYARKTFTVQSPTSAIMKTLIDDDFDLYVNGVLVLSNWDNNASYIDIDISAYLQSGVNSIAIKASDTVGGCQSLAFDVTIQQGEGEGKIPIVLVPGIVASWNTGVLYDTNPNDPNWSWTNLQSVLGIRSSNTQAWADAGTFYEDFMQALQNQGYRENIDYKVCFYDWRKTVDWTSQDGAVGIRQIEKCIDDLQEQSADPNTKVYLVAHSLGGLVSRSYIESPYYRQDVKALITVGTPHYGSVSIYNPWEGAVIDGNFIDTIGLRVALRVMVDKLKKTHRGDANYDGDYNTIHSALKSLKDLLPIGSNYLYDSQSGREISWDYMHEVNTTLKNIMPPDMAASKFSQKGVRLITIQGTQGQNAATPSVLQVRPYLFPPLWIDGQTIGIKTYTNGDGTVTISSAFLPGTESRPVTANHNTIINDATSVILEELLINNSIANSAAPIEPNNVLVLLLFSPATITMYDTSGNIVGEYGSIDDVKTAMAIDILPGQYTLKVNGTGQGPYELVMDYFSRTSDSQVVVTGTAIVGSEDVFSLEYDPSNPTMATQLKRMVAIDIKPGETPNPINLGSPGLIPVAILSTATFNATTVEPSYAQFGPNRTTSVKSMQVDVNNDGRLDLVVYFNNLMTGIKKGDTQTCLIGQDNTGLAVGGCDSIVIRPRR